MKDKGHNQENMPTKMSGRNTDSSDFVLDKDIFSSVFEKDIRRVYVYKKAERLAKAIHLIAPAFINSGSLRDRLDRVSVHLIDAAILPPVASREALSRELLALSSLLSIARTGGMLSAMNAELIAREAHTLLQEVATYEEPRLVLEEVPTLSMLAKTVAESEGKSASRLRSLARVMYDPEVAGGEETQDKGHITDIKDNARNQTSTASKVSDRRDAILSVLRLKGPSSIKQLSTVIRDVSEKTIQRELGALIAEGRVLRAGDRRWTTYSLQ
ncbi:MAG: hypothetical protein AB199_00040 [Parcubacteria bacterium C7867-004]|nr:MAG: hypothetical protein AB199_00040 [Parcubacteria bacterium C7867-004]